MIAGRSPLTEICPRSDEKKRIGRASTIATGEPNIRKHAIVDVPSVTSKDQTINPQIEREFSLKSVKFTQGIAHKPLPTLKQRYQDRLSPISRYGCDLQHGNSAFSHVSQLAVGAAFSS
jgi:hypothetical protein